MSPTIKYTLGRLALFLVCAFLAFGLLPRDLNDFLKLLVALLASLPLSYVLLRTWRNEMAEQMVAGHERRVTEKRKLRSALAGEDEPVADEPAKDQPTTDRG
jgi:hypothetical protein